ncbi:MAG: WPE palindromic element domain-containing protein [Wolbachia sp.]
MTHSCTNIFYQKGVIQVAPSPVIQVALSPVIQVTPSPVIPVPRHWDPAKLIVNKRTIQHLR